MFTKYLLLCASGGLIHGAFAQTKSAVTNMRFGDLPLWMSSTQGTLVIGAISLLSLIAEIILGIAKISVWAGLFLWIPVDIVMGMLFARIWPSISFFLGLVFFIIFFILILNTPAYF